MLHYNAVSDLLKDTLHNLMEASIFDSFRLVGGTALSLHLGHRESIDIDLFSDVQYGTVDFNAIETYLLANFVYVDHLANIAPAMGKSFTVGTDAQNSIKLDVFYTDPFIQPAVEADGIRLASIDEIVAMKVDVIQRKGREKDFWDLHEVSQSYTIQQMLALHEQRYPYGHDRALIIENFTHFDRADNDFDPICFRGKYWDFIKADFEESIKEI